MATKIEAIARAIMDCDASGGIRWKAACVVARAALEAMREPSAAMTHEDVVQVVVGCCGMRPEHAREVWGQMIDAALAERPPHTRRWPLFDTPAHRQAQAGLNNINRKAESP